MISDYIAGYYNEYRCDNVDDLIRQLEEFKGTHPKAVDISVGVFYKKLEGGGKKSPTLRLVYGTE